MYIANKISKREITKLAKRVGKINEELQIACMLAEELSHNELLLRILDEKDEGVLSELREKVLKYGNLDSPTNVSESAYYFDEATAILSAIFDED